LISSSYKSVSIDAFPMKFLLLLLSTVISATQQIAGNDADTLEKRAFWNRGKNRPVTGAAIGLTTPTGSTFRPGPTTVHRGPQFRRPVLGLFGKNRGTVQPPSPTAPSRTGRPPSPTGRPPSSPDICSEQLLLGKVLNGKYKVEGLIGKGGFSVVFSATYNGEDFAVKCLTRTNNPADNNEITILQQLTHKNVVKFEDSFVEDNQLFTGLNTAD
jgi:hypothetical protein